MNSRSPASGSRHPAPAAQQRCSARQEQREGGRLRHARAEEQFVSIGQRVRLDAFVEGPLVEGRLVELLMDQPTMTGIGWAGFGRDDPQTRTT